MRTVNIVAVERQTQCTLVVVQLQYEGSLFQVLLQVSREAEDEGCMTETCRLELHKLVDGLMDWEITNGTVSKPVGVPIFDNWVPLDAADPHNRGRSERQN